MKASIIYTLKAPCNHPNGLDWDNGSLWVVCGNRNVFKINPHNGEVLHSFKSPGHAGVMYDGKYIWVVESPPPCIYQVDPKNFELVRPMEVSGPVPIGLAWDGKHIWHGEHHRGLFKIDPSDGKILSQFPGAGDRTHDMTWDGTNLWFNDTNKKTFYKMDPNDGKILDSFPSPDNIEPHGLTWDGETLWFTESGNRGDFIHQLRIMN